MASVTNNGLSRDIGGLEARMKNTEERLERMEKKIDELVEIVAASKGGVRTLIAVSSVVAAATAAVMQIVHWLGGSIRP